MGAAEIRIEAAVGGHRPSLKPLELADNLGVGRPVRPGIANVLPADGAIFVQQNSGWCGQPVVQQVEHPVFSGNPAPWVVKDRELQAQQLRRKFDLRKVVGCHRQDLRPQRFEFFVVFPQLHELHPTVYSPETAEEYQDHVTFTPVSLQADLFAACAG